MAISNPRIPGICEKPISTAAPALNPRITECETKLRNTPRRAIPIPACITPTMSDSTNASSKYLEVPGAASSEREVNTTKDMAVVGPVMRWAELPQRLAMIVGMMEAYNPN